MRWKLKRRRTRLSLSPTTRTRLPAYTHGRSSLAPSSREHRLASPPRTPTRSLSRLRRRRALFRRPPSPAPPRGRPRPPASPRVSRQRGACPRLSRSKSLSPLLLSLLLIPPRPRQNRALARYSNPDRSTLPPPLLQIDAYQRAPNPSEPLTKYLEARRAVLALDGDDPMDGGDKDAIGEPAQDTSLDAGRDSDEDAIGSEHPRSPSFGPSASPVAAQRQLEPRLPTPTPSSPRPTSGTAGNTTGELLALQPYQLRTRLNTSASKAMSSPEPRSTISAPPRTQQAADQKKPAAPPDSVVSPLLRSRRCSEA